LKIETQPFLIYNEHIMKKIIQHTLFLLSFLSLYTSVNAATNNISNQRHCAHIKLQILGEGGPEINDGLASSSYLVWINNKARVLVDAGGGSSFNFEKSAANFNDLQAILLSHLHVDHSAEIPVYLKAGYFSGRKNNLPLFGPAQGGNFPSTEAFINALISDRQSSAYPYLADNLYQQASTDFLIIPQSIHAEKKPWQKKITDDLFIKAINVNHGSIPALAWRVESKQCSITFSGDMNGSSGNLQKLAKNTNILVAHNAIAQQAFSVAKELHMTPLMIGKIAQQAKVKKLVLSHFMLRSINKKQETKAFIRKSYSGEIIEAQALMMIEL